MSGTDSDYLRPHHNIPTPNDRGDEWTARTSATACRSPCWVRCSVHVAVRWEASVHTSARSPCTAQHRTPDVYLIMNAIVSFVANSACASRHTHHQQRFAPKRRRDAAAPELGSQLWGQAHLNPASLRTHDYIVPQCPQKSPPHAAGVQTRTHECTMSGSGPVRLFRTAMIRSPSFSRSSSSTTTTCQVERRRRHHDIFAGMHVIMRENMEAGIQCARCA